jgi:hypothetical protein
MFLFFYINTYFPKQPCKVDAAQSVEPEKAKFWKDRK